MTLHYKTFTHLLYQTAHAWRLAVDRHLKHSGLSMSSWMAIGLIASETRPLTQTELAQMLTRVQPPEDRRKRHLVLTEKGNQAFALVKSEADALRADLLGDIDPQALATTEQVLQQLLTRMGNM